MADPWKRIKQSPATSAPAAGSTLSVTFDAATPLDSTHSLVAVVQWAGGGSEASNSWGATAISGSGSNGTNYVAAYIVRGDGSKNSFALTFSSAVSQAAITLLAFEGYVTAAAHTSGGASVAAATSVTVGPPSAATTLTPTIGIVATGLGSGGGGTWGTWDNGFTTVPISQSRLHVGVIAYTATGASPQSTITHTSSRAHRNLAFTVQGNAPASNTPPTVSAGADIKRLVGDGTTSITAVASDPGGSIAAYSWAVVSSDVTAPALTGANTATVTVPASDRPSTVTLRCTVEDNQGATAYDDVTVQTSIDRGLPTDVAHTWRKRYRGASNRVQSYRGKSTDLGLIAEWNFEQDTGAFLTKDGALGLARVGTVPRVASPWGYAADLTGSPNYLSISQDLSGPLNLGDWAATGVTVAAWVRREDTDTGFIAGGWQEDSANPRRQYGLFIDLGMYGGSNQSCFHVSKTGGPTPGYTYSRDYSASGATVTNGVWELHVGTYNGAEMRSYLNGAFTAVPSYTDNQNQTYSKNPYSFPDGLNATPVEFTVGAVRLSGGMGNFFDGQIARLRVWNRALSAAEVSRIYTSEVPT